MTIRVLVADDHAVVRDGLRALLDAQPDLSVVGTAGDGREAVRQVQRLLPDIAILDIAMPELNGIDAAQQIRQVAPETGIIMLSMHASAEHILRALQAGARGYLLKDSAGAEVAAAVRGVHAGARYLSRQIAEAMLDDYIRQRQSSSPLDNLAPREREILQLIVEGKSSAQVAESLSLSTKTVETYRSRMMQKLGISDLPGLVKFAIQHGLTPLE